MAAKERPVPARNILQEDTASKLNSNITGLMASVKELTKTSLGVVKRAGGMALAPAKAVGGTVYGETFGSMDKSKIIGLGVARAINPILGHLTEKLIENNKEALKQHIIETAGATKEFIGRKFVDAKHGIANFIERRNERKGKGAVAPRETTRSVGKMGPGQNRLQLTSYTRSHKSADTTEAVDLLRISNAEWLKALGTMSPERLKSKPLPKAERGGVVTKTGQAIVHKGEVITPTKVLGKQLDYLGSIAHVLSRGILRVRMAKTSDALETKLKLEEAGQINKLASFGGMMKKQIEEQQELNKTIKRLVATTTTGQKAGKLTGATIFRKVGAFIADPFREERNETFQARTVTALERLVFFFGAMPNLVGISKDVPFSYRLDMMLGKMFRKHPFFQEMYTFMKEWVYVGSVLRDFSIGWLFKSRNPLLKGKNHQARIEAGMTLQITESRDFYDKALDIWEDLKGSLSGEEKKKKTRPGEQYTLFNKYISGPLGKVMFFEFNKPKTITEKAKTIQGQIYDETVTQTGLIEKLVNHFVPKKEEAKAGKIKLSSLSSTEKFDAIFKNMVGGELTDIEKRYVNVFQRKLAKRKEKIKKPFLEAASKTYGKASSIYQQGQHLWGATQPSFLSPTQKYQGMEVSRHNASLEAKKTLPAFLNSPLIKLLKKIEIKTGTQTLATIVAMREERIYRKTHMEWLRKNDESKKVPFWKRILGFLSMFLMKFGWVQKLAAAFKAGGLKGLFQHLFGLEKTAGWGKIILHTILSPFKVLWKGVKGIFEGITSLKDIFKAKGIFGGLKEIFAGEGKFAAGMKGVIAFARMIIKGAKPLLSLSKLIMSSAAFGLSPFTALLGVIEGIFSWFTAEKIFGKKLVTIRERFAASIAGFINGVIVDIVQELTYWVGRGAIWLTNTLFGTKFDTNPAWLKAIGDFNFTKWAAPFIDSILGWTMGLVQGIWEPLKYIVAGTDQPWYIRIIKGLGEMTSRLLIGKGGLNMIFSLLGSDKFKDADPNDIGLLGAVFQILFIIPGKIGQIIKNSGFLSSITGWIQGLFDAIWEPISDIFQSESFLGAIGNILKAVPEMVTRLLIGKGGLNTLFSLFGSDKFGDADPNDIGLLGAVLKIVWLPIYYTGKALVWITKGAWKLIKGALWDIPYTIGNWLMEGTQEIGTWLGDKVGDLYAYIYDPVQSIFSWIGKIIQKCETGITDLVYKIPGMKYLLGERKEETKPAVGVADHDRNKIIFEEKKRREKATSTTAALGELKTMIGEKGLEKANVSEKEKDKSRNDLRKFYEESPLNNTDLGEALWKDLAGKYRIASIFDDAPVSFIATRLKKGLEEYKQLSDVIAQGGFTTADINSIIKGKDVRPKTFDFIQSKYAKQLAETEKTKNQSWIGKAIEKVKSEVNGAPKTTEDITKQAKEIYANKVTPTVVTAIEKSKDIMGETKDKAVLAANIAKQKAEPYIQSAVTTAAPYVEKAKTSTSEVLESLAKEYEAKKAQATPYVEKAKQAAMPAITYAADKSKEIAKEAVKEAQPMMEMTKNFKAHAAESAEGLKQGVSKFAQSTSSAIDNSSKYVTTTINDMKQKEHPFFFALDSIINGATV
jgi:hypothetical protein